MYARILMMCAATLTCVSGFLSGTVMPGPTHAVVTGCMQVCRNVQGQEWAAEADAGLTLAQAEAAIAAVFDRVLLPAGPLLAPAAPEKQQLPCISQVGGHCAPYAL